MSGTIDSALRELELLNRHIKPDPCACIGPQNGQPLCPCEMRSVVIRGGRYIRVEDLGPVSEGRKWSFAEEMAIYRQGLENDRRRGNIQTAELPSYSAEISGDAPLVITIHERPAQPKVILEQSE